MSGSEKLNTWGAGKRFQTPNQKSFHQEDTHLRQVLRQAGWEVFQGLAFLYLWRADDRSNERRWTLRGQDLASRIQALRRAAREVL